MYDGVESGNYEPDRMWVPKGKAVASALTLVLSSRKPVRATCVGLPDKCALAGRLWQEITVSRLDSGVEIIFGSPACCLLEG